MIRAFVVALVVACSSTPRPHDTREEVVVVGDVTLRSTRTGGVVVLVRRTQDGVEGVGDATLSASTLDAAKQSPHLKLAAARAWLAAARAAPPAASFIAAQHGIEELGADYAPGGAIDDTANYLKMAALDRENPERAARTEQRALENRIQLYLRRNRGEVE